jgi:hypothetical protein
MDHHLILTAVELRVLQFAKGIAAPFRAEHAAATMQETSINSIYEAAETLVRKGFLKRPGHDSRGPANYEILPQGVDYLRSVQTHAQPESCC